MTGIIAASSKEWHCTKEYFRNDMTGFTEYLFGEYFETSVNGKSVLFCKCGARKSNASASAQYIIDHFSPEKIVLIGTAAGINKRFSLLDILIPDTAIQGDCNFIENGQPFQGRFITHLDLSKYNVPASSTIASFDKPLVFRADCELMEKYQVDIRDMESGAIANICSLNHTELVIIKGITDFPGNYEADDERAVPGIQRKRSEGNGENIERLHKLFHLGKTSRVRS